MKPEMKIVALFVFPILAVFACAAVSFSLPVKRPYTPERPEFLGYIDRLGVSAEATGQSSVFDRIRNVFTYDVPEKKDAPDQAPAAPPAALNDDAAENQDKTPSHVPVWVSMVVEGGDNSFSVINGQKMRIGERGDSFTLTSIHKGSVTIRHTDGTEEIIHVKAF
jgi:hypothetical protein